MVDLDELERLYEHASFGAWTLTEDGEHNAMIDSAESVIGFILRGQEHDARVIVATHNALPALLRELRELRAELAARRAADDPARLIMVAWKVDETEGAK